MKDKAKASKKIITVLTYVMLGVIIIGAVLFGVLQ
ncbi:hypothetical protein PEPS_00690 [Persicobacter psychrovividus]|uniref:DUF4044 domain-containing protein n=1 Tax=Persicobacter psychrovividus TaxID=387638 RepID=A0ABM7VA38_9BACT|nr:hypothetical protein PEPS_00690 [Persicobacter psychrovividus]